MAFLLLLLLLLDNPPATVAVSPAAWRIFRPAYQGGGRVVGARGVKGKGGIRGICVSPLVKQTPSESVITKHHHTLSLAPIHRCNAEAKNPQEEPGRRASERASEVAGGRVLLADILYFYSVQKDPRIVTFYCVLQMKHTKKKKVKPNSHPHTSLSLLLCL